MIFGGSPDAGVVMQMADGFHPQMRLMEGAADMTAVKSFNRPALEQASPGQGSDQPSRRFEPVSYKLMWADYQLNDGLKTPDPVDDSKAAPDALTAPM